MKNQRTSQMFASVKRATPRLIVMAMLGIFFHMLSASQALALGPVLAPAFMGLGVTLMSFVVSDLALRIMQPNVDGQACAADAMINKNSAAGLVYLGRSLLAAVVMIMVVSASRI